MSRYRTLPSRRNRATSAHNQQSRQGLALAAPNLIQAQLRMGTPGDRYEQEADQMANHVIRQLAEGTSVASKPLDASLSNQADHLQLKSSSAISGIGSDMSAGFSAPNPIARQLQAGASGGTSLPSSTRAEMEGVFGVDFGGVRIHHGEQAAQMTESLNAKAFTHGSDIYFNRATYDPESTAGKHLLAHELTHVVQQQSGPKAVQGLFRWQRINSGRKTMGPGITVRWSGNRMRITANMEIYGPEANAEVAQDFEDTIERIWTASFSGGYQVSCNADVAYRDESTEASSNRTQVFVDDLSGPSNVTRHWLVGSRYMNYDISSDINWTPAHEFGHLLGLPDHYSEGIISKISGRFGGERENTVDEGWDGNLMAVHGGVLERKNLEEWFQLNAYEMVTIVEDAIDEVSRGIGQFEDSLRRGINPLMPH